MYLTTNPFFFFQYRFIKFEYMFEQGYFRPILFNTAMPFD